MRKKILFTPLLLLATLLALGTENPDVQIPPPPAKVKGYFLGMPFIYYSPETRLSFGAAASYIFRTAKNSTRPSSISPMVVYTQERQFRFFLQTDLFLKNTDYHLLGYLKLEYYPDRFYGIGNRNQPQEKEVFTSRGEKFNIDFIRRIRNSTYAGLRYQYSHWSIVHTEPGHRLSLGEIAGSRGGHLSGLSMLLTHDNRDNIYSPSKGEFIEATASGYFRFLGSGFTFRSLNINARKYISLFSDHVLALQTLLTLQSGEVPFLELGYLGGQSTLRGYYWGMYRDRNLALVQAEYRLPLFWRLKMTAFAGLGDVAPIAGKLSLLHAKPSIGLGLRYLFSKAEKITLRLDVALGQKSSGIYFSIFEAF